MVSFGETLRAYRVRAKLSQNALGKHVGINASYINRLESGERVFPSAEVVEALARTLRLGTRDTTILLLRAGKSPEWLRRNDEAVLLVALLGKVVTHPNVQPADAESLVKVVAAMVRMWDEGVAPLVDHTRPPALAATGG